MIRFGSSGNPEQFYADGNKSSLQMPGWLERLGLNAYEYQCSKGVNISEKTALALGEKAKEHGIKEVGIKVQGPGSGRETAVKSVGGVEGIKVTFLKDITPLAHNGCRPPKRRRV